jgi:retron-type reverse transcriptase
LRKYDYVLKCDLRKYFPSIDHEILKSLIRKKISDNDTLWLIDRIIDRSNLQDTVFDYYAGDNLLTPLQRRKGLPIGNLTSQFFANLYLNPLDHFVKDILRCPAYLRYVDDFALFSDSKGQLRVWKEDIARFLEKYRLRLHPRRCHIILSQTGSRFLGQVIFRSHRRLCGDNVRRFKKRLRGWQHHPPDNLQQRLNSWIGHARQADTLALLKALSKVHKTMFNFVST